jgi:hypothetical protein
MPTPQPPFLKTLPVLLLAGTVALLGGACASRRDGPNLASIRRQLPETITPISAAHLATKMPRSYFFDYPYEPQPGKRLWRRVDASTWHEIYPDGHTSVFKVLGHARVENTEGTIVVKQAGDPQVTATTNDGGLQAFIPDLGSAKLHHWYRNTARGDTTWNDLAPMQDVR